ncbi:glycosyltransferase [Nocardioides immobilis]|uniref:Glycosyltransferase n=1 Tax=Nocardioides immobilis TaxID=2049295 RepID=A0A417Y545_9ACTN|nr:glycosyltransferase [Nocardioides immobilis]RHW27802.1 glycosyltransferase [Nocardioides immobilis]
MRWRVEVERLAAAVYDVPGQAAWRVRIGGRYLLTVGGVAAENGTIDLLEAHAALAQEHAELADLRLVIAGGDEPADEDYLAEFTSRAAGLGTRPLRLGPVADATYPALVAGAAALGYLPTRDPSCPAALEALAAGVPVVARDLPEVRALLGDTVAYGDTVLSIADAIVDVLTDPPDPAAGVELAASYALGSEDGVVEEQPDRGDRREE